jgi:outer membrane biosynthesis protein TonB
MNKIHIASILLSLSIHASLIGAFNGQKMGVRAVQPPAPLKNKVQDVSFEFVEVPDAVPETKEVNKESRVISDKSVKAKDASKKEDAREHKARAKEIYKSKQIAKVSMPSVQPTPPPQPVTQEVEKQKLPDAEGPKKPEQQASPPMPVPEPPRKVEYDIVNLPEVSESIFSAPDMGPLSFEAQAHKIGPYFKEVKKRIEKYWMGYLLFKYQNSAPQESETVVKFKILPSGEVTAVSVVEYSGDVLFRDFSVASITNTSPFPPLPENLKEELKKEGGLEIIFTFRYR